MPTTASPVRDVDAVVRGGWVGAGRCCLGAARLGELDGMFLGSPYDSARETKPVAERFTQAAGAGRSDLKASSSLLDRT